MVESALPELCGVPRLAYNRAGVSITGTHVVYHEHLEAPFLDATERYYRHESEKFLAENSAADYRKKAEGWLREEQDRVERYMNPNTRAALVQKCKDVLFGEHAELIGEGTPGAAAADSEADQKS